MNSPPAWLRRGGGFRGEPLRFLVRRPLRGKPRASRVLCDLARRRFGPFRPYFPKNPRGSVRLCQRIAREQFLDAAFCDDHGGIVVRVVPMSAALTDELGLTGPVDGGKNDIVPSPQISSSRRPLLSPAVVIASGAGHVWRLPFPHRCENQCTENSRELHVAESAVRRSARKRPACAMDRPGVAEPQAAPMRSTMTFGDGRTSTSPQSGR